MPEDAMQTKEKIISLLRMNGPSLPVHISKATGLSILFASAFLSELIYENKIKISNMKVGSSPLYYLPGHEFQLERFSNHIKGKEKEAFLLLKEKKFLKDSEQEPAIRIAIREIKDFAVPFKRDEEIYWRFFNVSKEELFEKEKPKEIKIKEEITEKPLEEKELIQKPKKKREPRKIIHKEKEELNIFEVPAGEAEKKKVARKRDNRKYDDKFFNKIKEFLSGKNMEIIDIRDFNKSELTLKVKENQEEKLIIAYNKKRLTETDLIKAYKKSTEANLPCVILTLGELSKKFRDLISAIKGLSRIDRIE